MPVSGTDTQIHLHKLKHEKKYNVNYKLFYISVNKVISFTTNWKRTKYYKIDGIIYSF